MVASTQRARMGDAALTHTCILRAPRSTLLPFAGFIDTPRHAAEDADRSRQAYCKESAIAGGGQPGVSSCGAKVSASRDHSSRDRYNCIVVVGILPDCLDVGRKSCAFLPDSRRRGAILVGLCTGGFILANAGFMSGRKCDVHLTLKPDLEAMCPDVQSATEETLVIDDNIITCPGGTAAINLATEIISHHLPSVLHRK